MKKFANFWYLINFIKMYLYKNNQACVCIINVFEQLPKNYNEKSRITFLLLRFLIKISIVIKFYLVF